MKSFRRVTGMPFVLLFVSIVLGALGQILMKWGLISPKPLWQLSPSALQLVSSWPVLLGLGSYGLSSVFWLMTLKRMDLSLAYPMVSVGYILVLAAGGLLFHEPIPAIRFWGMGLILIGVFVVSRS
jgi:multidrug transporter EmrE-like cation transporter